MSSSFQGILKTLEQAMRFFLRVLLVAWLAIAALWVLYTVGWLE